METMVSNKTIRESWVKMIASIDKYFHIKPNEVGDVVYRQFIISDKKAWAFDVINKALSNYSRDCGGWLNGYNSGDHHKGARRVSTFIDDAIDHVRDIYDCKTKPYSNGNTLVIITITHKPSLVEQTLNGNVVD